MVVLRGAIACAANPLLWHTIPSDTRGVRSGKLSQRLSKLSQKLSKRDRTIQGYKPRRPVRRLGERVPLPLPLKHSCLRAFYELLSIELHREFFPCWDFATPQRPGRVYRRRCRHLLTTTT